MSQSAMQGWIESVLQGGIKVSPCTRWDKQILTFLLLPKNCNARWDRLIMHGGIKVFLSTRWDKH